MTSPSEDEPLPEEVEEVMNEVWEEFQVNGCIPGHLVDRAEQEFEERIKALGYRKPH